MNTIEILEKARELISAPKHWTTKHYAKDEDGDSVHYRSAKACRFCSDGALRRVTLGDTGRMDNYFQAYNLLNKLVRENSSSRNIINFNDEHSHAEVLALFDRAIAAAKAVGAPVEAV